MKYMLRILLITVSFIFAFNYSTTAAESSDSVEAKEHGQEEEKLISISAGCTYSSIYFWRGEVLFDGAPAFFPAVAAGIGNFTIGFMSGINETLFTAEDTNTEKIARRDIETDYTASYSIETEMLSVEAGLTYVQYLFYDEEIEVDGAAEKAETDPSFCEANINLTANTILSPTIVFYYDYYVDENIGEDGEKTPVNRDYYIQFSISHDLISTDDGFALAAGAWAGYYNNSYYEMKGWSDAAASVAFTKEYKALTVFSAFYYGRTLGKDFRECNGGKKNNFWCDFGLTWTM